ncbi:MAG: S1 RNA-binding domain-containing protein [Anaerolineae bacterium]|jgi:ribosomal protein S1|nr:S1 RNA-binding domain-containing protein [Anaerolineae bacterium]
MTTPLSELKVGMQFQATVKAIELYGAFVDIGIGSDALLHISQFGKPVKNVEDTVKVGEKLTVYIIKVDVETKRIAVSLVKPASVTWEQIIEGVHFSGEVVRVESYGAFVDIGAERPGMVHISELADGFVRNASDVVKVGDTVNARVLKVNRKKKQIDLSLKAQEEARPQIVEDPEEEPAMTAFALAFQKANAKGASSAKNAAKHAQRAKRQQDREDREDIFERTLKNHRG